MAESSGKPIRKILLVDDNIDHVRTIAVMLKRAGYDVDYAFNGLIAVEMAQRLKPDTVILDLNLPDMHGSELARRIRAYPQLKGTRLICLTGETEDAQHRRARDAGCDMVLLKSGDQEAIKKALGN